MNLFDPTPSEAMRQDARDQRELRADENTRWGDPDDHVAAAASRARARSANAIEERRVAWAANPHCLVCGTATASPERSALLETPDGHRVSCKSPCFAVWVARTNPSFSTSVALRRAEVSQ